FCRQQARPQVDPGLDEGVAQALAHGLVEAAQGVAGSKKPRDLGAEPRENAGEFHRYIAAADHGEALGKFFEVENLIRTDGVLHARDISASLAATSLGQSNSGFCAMFQPKACASSNSSAKREA